MIEGTTFPTDPDLAPMRDAKDKRNTYQFIQTAQTSYPMDSMGTSWRGDYVFNSGNLVLDLLHNFFLECGARTHKMRVYEMTDNPVAREMIGYLLVRGGVHFVAYAKALEVATGVDVTKLVPIPNLDNSKFDATRKFEAEGVYRRLYTFSDHDYKDIDKIWKGTHPTEGGQLEVIQAVPEGGPIPDFEDIPETFAPGTSQEEFMEITKRLQRSANISD